MDGEDLSSAQLTAGVCLSTSDRLDEAQRLQALASFAILDTAPEDDFDSLTRLAAQLCGTPIALVSLVAATRQWFKAKVGLTDSETPREHSICAHALGGPDLLVVRDASQDERFKDYPNVTGPPHIRFYAGAPLVTSDGYVLGTLCVIDTVPRTLTPTQSGQLKVLAAQVVTQLEFRRQARQLAAEMKARAKALAALRENARLLDGVLQHTDVLIYAKDRDGRFMMANRAVTEVTAPEGGLLGRTDHDMFDAEMADEFRRNDLAIMSSGERQLFTEELVHPDGTTHTYRSTKYPVLDDAGEIIGIAGVSTDVTELTAARAAHAEAEMRWRTLIEESPVAVQVVGGDGLITYANRSALAVYGASTRSEVESHPATDFATAEQRDAVAAMMQDVLDGGTIIAQTTTLRQVDGTEITVELSAARINDGGQLAMQVELRDVTAAARAQKALEQIASTDPLTGVLNRRAWHTQLRALITGAGQHGEVPLIIALIDFDNFKIYNDTRGHAAGDDLLRDFAATARAALRETDVFARWGGEEFILALPGTRSENAAQILERLRLRIPGAQTCSIGHTMYRAGEPLEDAISRADNALYEAKDRGRNRIVQR